MGWTLSVILYLLGGALVADALDLKHTELETQGDYIATACVFIGWPIVAALRIVAAILGMFP